MTKVIYSSFGDRPVSTGLSLFSKLSFYVRIGRYVNKYREADFAEVERIEMEQSRSVGKAAAGAIIGGALTGGIGLIAGAAIGGRQRKEATYLIRFLDGQYVVISETERTAMKRLDEFAQKTAARKIAMKAGEIQ